MDEFPYLEAEVKYAVKEYACTAVDVLARRTRLAFLHVHAADEAIPKIINIMGKELGWSKPRMKVTDILINIICYRMLWVTFCLSNDIKILLIVVGNNTLLLTFLLHGMIVRLRRIMLTSSFRRWACLLHVM